VYGPMTTLCCAVQRSRVGKPSIGADGTGAIVGGPPPIGFKITVVFFDRSGDLEITAHEGSQSAPFGRMKYDSLNNTLSSLDGVLLHRRFDELTDDMRRSIGLPVP
jgi:hypothetical protein